jgi:hypothetical protein
MKLARREQHFARGLDRTHELRTVVRIGSFAGKRLRTEIERCKCGALTSVLQTEERRRPA